MKKSVKILIPVIAIILIVITGIVGASYYLVKSGNQIIDTGKIDDWKYTKESNRKYNSSKSMGIQSMSLDSAESFMPTSKTNGVSNKNIGLSVGGAKNVENFRENIKNGYFPISTDITYNGLFYDYYFETGESKNKKDLFSPAYSKAISKDPISNANEYYMTVGLNSNIKESDFKRKKQNIVVLLDISGSMDSALDSYYYDQNILERIINRENKTKMQLANESVNLMIDTLKDDDRFGMVLFDDSAYLGKEITIKNETDVVSLKKHILEIEANGGTNFEAGYKEATNLFTKEMLNDKEYENRVVIITDAMPNIGKTKKSELLKYIEENADNGIYTSLIGIGVDFNTDLTEAITNVKGANYYSISEKNQFKKILSEEFDYMVTPLVFDLSLDFNSNDYEIAEVYGTDSLDKSSGNIMKVNTLFPSSTTDEGTKGGVILLKLKKKNNEIKDGKITLDVSYKDRDGKEFKNSEDIEFNENKEFYENTGIRKSIALVRYANTIKNWILYERIDNNKDKFILNENCGIKDFDYTKEEIYKILGEHERTSVNLTVSEDYKNIFKTIKDYMENEMTEVNDKDLKQEIEILDKLINN